jgi:fructokinase
MLSLLCCPQTGRKFRPVIRFEGGNPAVNDIPLFGGIEAGGTKIVCASGTGPEDMNRAQFPSGSAPDAALAPVIRWLRCEEERRGRFRALGIGSFGPVGLDPHSPSYGRITTTPKEGWRNADILGTFRRAFPGIPIGFDTDVNAAAMGEHRWGAGRSLGDFVYITMGTGIGAGVMAGGKLLHGLVHPEAGHLRIPRLPGDAFPGICPFHGDCWEGLCSGPAILKRTGIPAEDLPGNHEAWPLTARYTAIALADLVCALSPRRIILGGSVPRAGLLGRDRFLAMVRNGVREALGGYISVPELSGDLSGYIIPPLLEENAGICGALALAETAWEEDRHPTDSRNDVSSR